MILPQLSIYHFDCFDSYDEERCVMLSQLSIVLTVLTVLMSQLSIVLTVLTVLIVLMNTAV